MNTLRWIAVLAGGLCLLAVAVVGLAAWLVGSERGTAWLVDTLARRAAPQLELQGLRGTLWRGVDVDTLRIRMPGHAVDVDGLSLRWDAGALARRELLVDAFAANMIAYRPLPQTTDTGASAPGAGDGVASPLVPALPVRIAVRDARVERVVLAIGEPPVELLSTTLTADVFADRIVIEHFATDAVGFSVVGSAEVGLAGPPSLAADILWEGEFDGQRMVGGGSLAGVWPQFGIEHALTEPFALSLTGTVDFQDEPRASLAVQWTDAAWPDWPIAASPTGTATLDGWIDVFDFRADGQLTIDGEPLTITVNGRSAGTAVEFAQLDVDSLYGRARVRGDVDLDALAWELAIEASGVDPGLVLPDWGGRLDARGTSSGRLAPALQWRADDLHVEGELRGFPFSLGGAIEHRPDFWEVEALRIASGANLITLHGSVSQQIALEVAADVEDLAALWPELAGAITGDARIYGTRDDPQLSGRLIASGLRYRDYRAESLELVSDIDGGAETALDLTLRGEQLEFARIAIAHSEARITGSLADHALSLAAVADGWSASLSARGSLSDEVWSGTAQSLTIDQDQLGTWRMATVTMLGLSRTSVRIDPLCLTQRDARLCGEVWLAGTGDDRIRLTAEQFDLRALAPFLPAEFRATGIYDAEFALTRPDGDLEGLLMIRAPSTRFAIGLPGQPAFETGIEDIDLYGRLQQRSLMFEAGFTGADTGVVNVSLAVDDLTADDPAVAAQLDVLWPDLAFLALLSPDVGEVGGSLAVQLSIDGRASEPSVQGRANLEHGTIGVPALGLTVSDIEVRAASPDGRSLAFDATGLIGDREIGVSGTTELDYRASFPTRLTLRGDAVPAIQLPEAEIFVSPDLTAIIQLPQISVTGTVDVPRARITIQELPAQAVVPSADTVVHGAEQPEVMRPIAMRSDLQLRLGDNVRYSGMNLDTRVSGELRLNYQSGRPASAAGVVTMDGTYNAYGQLLDLDRGELIFSGPLDDPALDVRAVREIGSRTVGVQLTGTLQSPQTRIFSNPAMSEADALAYLVFGRPLTGSRGEDTATLQSAAIAMGLQQALPVVQRIGQAMGLDEFTVQTTDDTEGALMAGKYLSPNVYIRYSYGLFNGIGGLLLRFRINDRLSLETRSAEHKSMDLLYTVERD